MTDTAIVHLGLQAMMMAFELAAPTLLTALLIGFGVSLFQSATQIQEFTLSFVPEGNRSRRGVAAVRQLDDAFDGHLHPAAVRSDPVADQLNPSSP